MKRTILILIITLSISFVQGQKSSTFHYGCFTEFTPTDKQGNGIWGKNTKTNLSVNFSVGKNKDIVVYSKGTKKIYHRTAEPILGETPGGTKFQFITTKCEGKVFVFQQLDNHNLRFLFPDENRMIEYGCVEKID